MTADNNHSSAPNLCIVELLEKYKSAIAKRREAESELNEQLQIQVAPDMKVKHRECKETEEQLKQIETRLGKTDHLLNKSPRHSRRGSPGVWTPQP